ncbi:flagellar basal body rod protein FlgB [Pararhizobium haloflavum]|uniref:flagellar basal body rod protein FlgB n=1 Tax=Pararhizobium haloflavum TaxID=2037914 RepID=UPI000C184EF3|nr:flagellar basal body rod protein FlgB [Pararhizobium haloflavum]
MDPIQLFDLASRQAHWLSVRQTVVAGNVANANTPGYAAKDVEPFEKVLATTGNRMAATHPAHFVEDSMRNSVRSERVEDGVDLQVSGNSVTVADELIKSGEIRRQFEMNTGLVRSFHRMMLMTVQR